MRRDGSRLRVRADRPLPDVLIGELRAKKQELLKVCQSSETAPGPYTRLAVLMRSPDGSRYWIAPDGAEFEAGGYPVLRRSVLLAWKLRGSDPEELRQMHRILMTMGGDATEADSS
jgi:hypothetical protein